jgi:beta-1,4-N-acetylglucosaminyltransferase
MAKKPLIALLLSLLAIALFLLSRLLVTINPSRPRAVRHARRNPHDPTHLLIVLGSGGHTAEMLAMLERALTDREPARRLAWNDFRHRTWVVSAGDALSVERATRLEEMAALFLGNERGNRAHAPDWGEGTYDIVTVPRARAIHQSLLTAPWSSLACLWSCMRVLTAHPGGHGRLDFPDLILCNGPATATMLVFASVLLRFCNWYGCASRGKMRTVYVESWARVKKLSLSGTLLSRVVDRFVVQWPDLMQNVAAGRAEYLGFLV